MEKEIKRQSGHCLVVPFPTQGHINPMLQFSKRLEFKGCNVTFAPTRFIFNTTMHDISNSIPNISIEPISDGADEGGFAKAAQEDTEKYLSSFKQIGTQTLSELIENLGRLGRKVDCIVYDSFMPWILDVAKRFELKSAVFFTQSCAVGNIFYHVYKENLELSVVGPNKILLPGLPPLELVDMPSFIYDLEAYPTFFKMMLDQFSNLEMVDWILCNTIYELEKEEVDWISGRLPSRTIGPTIPSMYVDKQLGYDKSYGLSMYVPKTETCMNWLNNKPEKSVIYVSFGSMAQLEPEQIQEMAMALKGLDFFFLWVVRTLEEAKLPKGFKEEVEGKGLVVSWCPQLDVLSHNSVGCFVTHCGWNSTLEALNFGIGMVGIPQWTDQSTNAKYVMDIWKMGLWVKPDYEEGSIVKCDAIRGCIRELMEGDKGKEFRGNAAKWKEITRSSIDVGGSSDRNINDFVSSLV